MKRQLLLTVLVLSNLFVWSQSRDSGDTSRADAILNNATVYFGYGAELTHDVKVKVNSTTRFIVINQLSTVLDLNSLQVSCPEEVTILSQRFTTFYPTNPIIKTKEVERWEDSIEALQNSNASIDNNIAIEKEVLQKTGLLIESALANNGNKAVQSAEVLRLVEFYNGRIERSKRSIYAYQIEIRSNNKRIDALRKKISEVGKMGLATQKPYGQIILQVMAAKSAEVPISLSYYTNHAGWTPIYDVRVNSKTNKVKLVYKASLMQTTGIDWKKTKLTLSTGTPTFGVAAPILSSWYLQLYVPGIYTDLQRRAAVGNQMRNRVQSFGENDDKEVIVNGYGTLKQESYYNDSVSPVTLQQFTSLNSGQLNTNFEIALPYDISSDGELHSVSIKDEEIDCILKNYAVPKVDKEAYLLAEVANWQNLDLLPGDANIIMDNTYIGKSIIDPNSTADTLNLPLGKDRRLAVKRSLVKELSSLKTSGKESKQTFTYEIVVKNNKLTDVNLLLKDQYPLSTIKEVEVELGNESEAAVNTETGVLTWKMELKPGESKKVRFSYTVKYPKDKKIVNLR
jgi:uncharacterized protein (TIGR02231 family)